MKITDLKCTVLGGNPVIRITTDEGICSWGEEEFSKPYLKSQVLFYRDLILGEDPTKWGIRVLDLNGETLSLPVVNEFPGQDRDGLLIDFAKLIRHKSLFPTSEKRQPAKLGDHLHSHFLFRRKSPRQHPRASTGVIKTDE